MLRAVCWCHQFWGAHYCFKAYANDIYLDNAFVEGQKSGPTPALCAPGSTFLLDLTSCLDCIAAHGSTTNVSQTVNLGSQFDQFIDYCSNQDPSSLNGQISSDLSAISAAETVEAALSSKVSAGLVSIYTQISTVVTVSVLTVDQTITASGMVLCLSWLERRHMLKNSGFRPNLEPNLEPNLISNPLC